VTAGNERAPQSVGEVCGLRWPCCAVPGGLKGRGARGATEGEGHWPNGEERPVRRARGVLANVVSEGSKDERCEADRREASMRTGSTATRERSESFG